MKIKNVLVLGYRHLGDTLFLTPAIKSIKLNFPHSYLAIITGKSSKDILTGNPYLQEIISLSHNSFVEKLKIINSLKEKKFDTVFLFQHTFLNALFAYILRAKNRVGLDWKGCGPLLTHKIKYNPNWHEIERYLNIVSLAGGNSNYKKPEIFLSQEDEQYANNFFKKNNISEKEKVVCINPGSSQKWKIKRWDIRNYADLIDYLTNNYQLKVLVIQGIFEKELIDNLTLLTKSQFTIIKETSLKRLSAIIKRSNLFITNDTGPMHLAVAMGVKVVDIVGPSNIQKTGPGDKNSIIIRKEISCSPCKKTKCDDLSCLKLITPKEVIEKIEKEIIK